MDWDMNQKLLLPILSNSSKNLLGSPHLSHHDEWAVNQAHAS